MPIEPVGRLQLELPLEQWLKHIRFDAKADSNEVLIGQQRAKQALNFALDMDEPGYHVFVAGDASTGKFSLVNEYVKHHQRSAQRAAFDYCYVHNFEHPQRPNCLKLEAGHATILASAVAKLLKYASHIVPKEVMPPSVQLKWLAAQRMFDAKCQQAMAPVRELAKAAGVTVNCINGAVSVDLESMTSAGQSDEQLSRLSALLDQISVEMASWRSQLIAQQREWLQASISTQVEAQLIELLKTMSHDMSQASMVSYLTQVAEALCADVGCRYLTEAMSHAETQPIKANELLTHYEKLYLPNIIVEASSDKPAEPFYEPNPTYERLFGRVYPVRADAKNEYTHHAITPGILHHANHHVLMLDIERLLEQPNVWHDLKLALLTQQLTVRVSHDERLSTGLTTLQPQPIQLQLKLILLGSRDWYYALQEDDDEFNELCKVLVEFDDDIPVSTDTLQAFITQLNQLCEHQYQMTLTRSGIERLLEASLKKAEHRHRLSAQIADVRELVCEAAYFGRLQGHNCIQREQVECAIKARLERTGRVNEVLFDDIRQGHVLISTSGWQVGTVNGLTIMDVGSVSFGLPAKISATVHAGTSGVVDIEREVELGQPIHSKGVMLLNGYLGFHYAQQFPLTLSANIALEQSYGYIDGDSASLGELIALLSAIANLPITQSIAVTGSLNQYGGVQSIGGINEKVEGFFRLCQERGLSGEQGVIMPKANLVNLVLDRAVIDAVDAGEFSIYAIDHVDQAIELLIGIPAGNPSRRGRFPKNSVHGLVQSRLLEIASIISGADDDE